MKVTHNAPPTTQNLDTTLERSAQAARAGQVNKADKSGSETFEARGTDGAKGANVEISDSARMMRKAAELAHSAPDIRKDKIAALKKSIADGTYQVDSGDLADRIIEEHLGADFGKNNL